MKNAKTILVILSAMLIFSAAASAAIIYEDANTYTFDGSARSDVRKPNIALFGANGYAVYLEFRVNNAEGLANHLWYANHDNNASSRVYISEGQIAYRLYDNAAATNNGQGSMAWNSSDPTKVGLTSDWHIMLFYVDPAGDKILFFVDTTYHTSTIEPDYVSYPGNTTFHSLGFHPYQGGTWRLDGQVRNLKIYDNGAMIVKVTPSSGSTNVTEGAAADSFTVALTTAPAADVTITLDPDTKDDIKLATQAPGDSHNLVFTKNNWNTPQTVLVTAYDDVDDEEAEDVWIYLTSASDDLKFNETAISPITVVVTDNDEYIPVFVETEGSTEVVEQGQTLDTYTVVLSNHAPKASVTVDIADVSNPDNVTITPAQLTFTADNWNAPQTVTVKAIDDSLGEMANHQTTISHTITSDDSAYNGAVTNLNVNITDNDVFRMPIIAKYLPEISFNPSAGPPYGKKLPGISLLAEGTVYLEFRVNAIDSKYATLWMIDNDQFEISLAVHRAGLVYLNTLNKTLSQNIWFDQEPLSDIGPKSGWHSLYVSWPKGPKPVEGWGRFVLDGKDEFPAGITNINNNNYDFTGITNPSTADGNHAIGANPSAASHNFDGQIRNLLVSNAYIPSLLTKVTHSSGATQVNENGKTSDSFTIQLRQKPTADVTLTLTPATDDIKLKSKTPGAPYNLTFTKDNWNAPQTVTVTTNDDKIAENDEILLISISAASTDANFHNQAFLPITVKVLDNVLR